MNDLHLLQLMLDLLNKPSEAQIECVKTILKKMIESRQPPDLLIVPQRQAAPWPSDVSAAKKELL